MFEKVVATPASSILIRFSKKNKTKKQQQQKRKTLCPVTVLVDSQVSDRCPWATCFDSNALFVLQLLSPQDAAIFLFEKRVLEKMSKRDKELILEALRKGASQLTRLRHPKILQVMQPLEESR